MENIVVSIVVFILVALLLTCIVLIIASFSKTKLNPDDLPGCEKTEPLAGKERALYTDLSQVGEKLGLVVFPKVSLGALVRPRANASQADAWRKMLSAEMVDFALCEPDGSKARLIVLHGDKKKEQVAFVEKACKKADMPLLIVRDYNLAGLEKALLQKTNPSKRGNGQRLEPDLEPAMSN